MTPSNENLKALWPDAQPKSAKKANTSDGSKGSSPPQPSTKQAAKPKPTKKNKKTKTAPFTSRNGVITRKSKEPRTIVYKQSNDSARLELNKRLSGRSDTPAKSDLSPFHLLHQKWLRRMGLKAGDPDYFPWPSTHIDNFSATSSAGGRRETGMLSYLGYYVGMNSPYTSDQRARLLNYIFEGILPPVDSLAYYREWGPPKTSPRLRKMAETIASFVKDAKRRRATNMTVAIQHWEDDLRYLRQTFYQGRFHFAWPDTRA